MGLLSNSIHIADPEGNYIEIGAFLQHKTR